jgi:hypothetical protein
MKNFNAIKFLYPESEFSMINDDVNRITWVGQAYPAEVAAIAANKESARAKLAALGLTGEEIAALSN